MTRRDYILIARCFNGWWNCRDGDNGEGLVVLLRDALKAQNPAFDVERFVRECYRPSQESR